MQSIIHQPGFDGVLGVVIGRFQKTSKISSDLLAQIIKSKKELNNIPIMANVDFGHTDPKITLPIGGQVKISVNNLKAIIEILEH